MVKPFDVQPVDASFGAVVTGLRLAELDEPTWTALHDTWLKYALLMRGTNWDKAEAQRVAAILESAARDIASGAPHD